MTNAFETFETLTDGPNSELPARPLEDGDAPRFLSPEHTRQSFEEGKRRFPKILAELAK